MAGTEDGYLKCDMGYAESLGLAIFHECKPDDVIAVVVWDPDEKVWLNVDDEPILHQNDVDCWQCGAGPIKLPTPAEVEAWEKEQSGSDS